MNRTQTFTTTLIIALSLALWSCKKTSENPTSPTASNTKLLTTGTWKLNKIEWLAKGGAWGAVEIPDTKKGATIAFNADNTYSAVSPSSTAHGTWKFSADYSQITIVNDRTGGTFDLTILSQTTLQMADMTPFSIISNPTDSFGYYYYSGERETYVH